MEVKEQIGVKMYHGSPNKAFNGHHLTVPVPFPVPTFGVDMVMSFFGLHPSIIDTGPNPGDSLGIFDWASASAGHMYKIPASRCHDSCPLCSVLSTSYYYKSVNHLTDLCWIQVHGRSLRCNVGLRPILHHYYDRGGQPIRDRASSWISDDHQMLRRRIIPRKLDLLNHVRIFLVGQTNIIDIHNTKDPTHSRTKRSNIFLPVMRPILLLLLGALLAIGHHLFNVYADRKPV